MGIMTVFTFLFLGSAVFISAQNIIFNSKLIGYISELSLPGVDAHKLARSGAPALRYSLPADRLPLVIEAYMKTLQWLFRISLIFVALSLLSVLGMKWKNVNGKGDDVPASGEV